MREGLLRSGVEMTADAAAQVRRGDLFWIAPDASRESVPHPHLSRASEPGNVLLDAGEGGLPKQSVAVVSQVSSVEKTRLGARIGMLSGERVEQILAGMKFQQASFFFDR